MKINSTYILLFLSSAFSILINAQSPHFETHQLDENYQNAKVELVFEAQNGLLWFGTSQGLLAYNGLNFIPYLKSDTTSNHVRAIYQNQEGLLSIGYQDGSIYTLEKRQLTPWQPEEGTPAVPITGFGGNESGQFWFATYGEGVYVKNGQHLYNFSQENGVLGNDIYVIEPDGKGRMWLGTDGGISICSMQNDEKIIENLTKADGLPDDIVRDLLRDEKGNFWIGMYDKGVCYYDVKKKKFTYPLAHWNKGIVSHLELFEGRELWIGTEGNSVWILSLLDGSVRKLSEDNQFNNTKIYDLHKDVEGNIWVVSNTQGISHANRQFEMVKTDFTTLQAIIADAENNIWVGTQTGLFEHGLDSLGNSYFKQYLSQINLNVISLFQDKFENLWIGTFGEGVYVFNKKSKQLQHFTERDGLTNNNILSIDGINEHVWLATLGGVTEIDLENDILQKGIINTRNFNEEDGLGTNFIYNVFIDSQERTWFATDGKGISVLENGELKNFPTATHIHENGQTKTTELKTVYAMTEDQQGHIWLSTAKEGIFEFDGKNFKHLTVKEGIRDLEITSLIADKKGNILIVHPTGIDILNPVTHHLIYYDEEVGIQNIDPYLNAVCTDQHDNIWLGGKNKLIKYIPLNETLEIHPRTLLNSVSIFMQPIDYQSNNSFSYDQNSLVFDYIGLWYTEPEAVKYRHQLQGYNPSWIETKDRKVTYSNLPAGNYVFRVTSTENEAWLDEPIVEYAFEIHSPFWERWWFILLIATIVGVLFLWLQKERDARLQRVNLLEKEKVESQLEALKSQINPHFLFNNFNTLVTIIDENPKQAVEYVEKLSDFYRSILQYRDQEVIPLEEEIALLENYHFLLKTRFGQTFQLTINLVEKSGKLVPLTLQMLVENAIKHNIASKAKPLKIQINMDENQEFITVTNNLQPKIKPEKSTKFGLQSLEKRYALLSGKGIKAEERNGLFRVKIPLL